MATPHSKFYKRFSRRFYLTMLLVAVLVGSLLVTALYTWRYSVYRERLVDTLGMQRAHVLGMARESARIAAVMLAIETPERLTPTETLAARRELFKRNLGEYR